MRRPDPFPEPTPEPWETVRGAAVVAALMSALTVACVARLASSPVGYEWAAAIASLVGTTLSALNLRDAVYRRRRLRARDDIISLTRDWPRPLR